MNIQSASGPAVRFQLHASFWFYLTSKPVLVSLRSRVSVHFSSDVENELVKTHELSIMPESLHRLTVLSTSSFEVLEGRPYPNIEPIVARVYVRFRGDKCVQVYVLSLESGLQLVAPAKEHLEDDYWDLLDATENMPTKEAVSIKAIKQSPEKERRDLEQFIWSEVGCLNTEWERGRASGKDLRNIAKIAKCTGMESVAFKLERCNTGASRKKLGPSLIEPTSSGLKKDTVSDSICADASNDFLRLVPRELLSKQRLVG
ncbi:hypothetical protein C8R44DRAFT_952776 [Mycena epipterygia]|nr:hypothetical protein C8R44DRAFT_952776 [Mycena epipterygia]